MERTINQLETICNEWECNLMLDYNSADVLSRKEKWEIRKVSRMIKKTRRIISMLRKVYNGYKRYER